MSTTTSIRPVLYLALTLATLLTLMYGAHYTHSTYAGRDIFSNDPTETFITDLDQFITSARPALVALPKQTSLSAHDTAKLLTRATPLPRAIFVGDTVQTPWGNPIEFLLTKSQLTITAEIPMSACAEVAQRIGLRTTALYINHTQVKEPQAIGPSPAKIEHACRWGGNRFALHL